MMNQIVIMGRLTRDPELRHTPNGVAVASFSLAVDRGYTPKDGGERQTDFIDIVAWRNSAEFVSKYFTKGQMAAVTGRLQIRDWTDKDGNKRRSAEVVADNIYFTESKKSRDSSVGSSIQRDDYSQSFPAPVEGSDFSELDMDDGDLPF
ncbi:MAG: single-stranded DNA-binding protein [Oscillospiraceae bacterium]|nr:single-stranded DNA-binding protein [Oscillospiraceae bacterium]